MPLNAWVLVGALALALAAAPAAAYEAAPNYVLPGAPVRITLAGSERHLSAILLAQDADTLRVLPPGEGERIIPLAQVERYRVRTETSNHSKLGMQVGFLAGAVAGVIAGADCDCSASGAPFFYAATLGLFGAGVGALAGAAVPAPRWEDVPPPGVSVRVRF